NRPLLTFPTRRSSDLVNHKYLVEIAAAARHISAIRVEQVHPKRLQTARATIDRRAAAHADDDALHPIIERGFHQLACAVSAGDQDRKSTRLNSSHVKI